MPHLKRAKTHNWPLLFLALLAQDGNVSRSARLAGVSRSAVYARRSRSISFREAMEQVETEATEALEHEARRRAVHGTERPVFYHGAPCGAVREYSDTLLIVLLKARAPERYRDRVRVEHVGGVQIRTVTVVKPTNEAQWRGPNEKGDPS